MPQEVEYILNSENRILNFSVKKCCLNLQNIEYWEVKKNLWELPEKYLGALDIVLPQEVDPITIPIYRIRKYSLRMSG